MDTKKLSAKLSSAPTATSLSGLSMLCVDSSGGLQKASLMKESSSGSALISSPGVWLVTAYSKSNPARMNLSIGIRNSTTVVLHQVFQQNMTLVFNQYGSVTVDSNSDITDAVYVATRLSMGSV